MTKPKAKPRYRYENVIRRSRDLHFSKVELQYIWNTLKPQNPNFTLDDLQEGLRQAIGAYNSVSKLSKNRPTRDELVAAIDEISQKTDELEKLFHKCDDITRRDLGTNKPILDEYFSIFHSLVSGRCDLSPREWGDVKQEFFLKASQDNLSEAEEALRRIRLMAAVAKNELRHKTPKTKPYDFALRGFFKDMINIYETATGRRAGISRHRSDEGQASGPLLNFIESCLPLISHSLGGESIRGYVNEITRRRKAVTKFPT